MRKVALALLGKCLRAPIVIRDPGSVLCLRSLTTEADGEAGLLPEIVVKGSIKNNARRKKKTSRFSRTEQHMKVTDLEESCLTEIPEVNHGTRAGVKPARDVVHASTGKTETQVKGMGILPVNERIQAGQTVALKKTEKLSTNGSEDTEQEGLTEIFAGLDLSRYRYGRKWEEIACKLLDYGIPLADIAKMLKLCTKLYCNGRWVDSSLKHLSQLGMSEQQIGRLISKWPAVFNSTDSMFESKIQFFKSIGIDTHTLQRGLHNSPIFFGASLHTMRKNAAFWKEYMKDVHADVVPIMMKAAPQLLTYNLQRTVELKLQWLESQQYERRLLLRNPLILCVSVRSLAAKVELLKQWGISDARSRARILREVCGAASAKLQARFDNLLAAGFSRRQVQVIVSRAPTVLRVTEGLVNAKVDYALLIMKESHEMLALSSVFWTTSLERRIKHRYEIVKELENMGVYKGSLSFNYFLSMDDETFKSRFAEKLGAGAAITPHRGEELVEQA